MPGSYSAFENDLQGQGLSLVNVRATLPSSVVKLRLHQLAIATSKPTHSRKWAFFLLL